MRRLRDGSRRAAAASRSRGGGARSSRFARFAWPVHALCRTKQLLRSSHRSRHVTFVRSLTSTRRRRRGQSVGPSISWFRLSASQSAPALALALAWRRGGVWGRRRDIDSVTGGAARVASRAMILLVSAPSLFLFRRPAFGFFFFFFFGVDLPFFLLSYFFFFLLLLIPLICLPVSPLPSAAVAVSAGACVPDGLARARLTRRDASPARRAGR